MSFEFARCLCSFPIPETDEPSEIDRWLASLSDAEQEQLDHLRVLEHMFGDRIIYGGDRKCLVSMSMDEFVTYKGAIDAGRERVGT